MLRFLRKYMKVIMVVFGSILMVIFLLPAGFSELLSASQNLTEGTFEDGSEITTEDLKNARGKMDLLRGTFGFVPNALDPQSPELHWLLLLREAERQGVYFTRARAVERLNEFLKQIKMTDEEVDKLLLNSGAKRAHLYQAFQESMIITEIGRHMGPYRQITTPKLRHTAQDFFSRIEVELVPLDVEKAASAITDMPEAELKAHFEKYKGSFAGKSEPYGFGYRLPSRIKLEYLTIDRANVQRAIEIDEEEAMRYYLDHPQEFLPTPEIPKSTTPEGPNPLDPKHSPTEGKDQPSNESKDGAAPDKNGAAAPTKPAEENKPAPEPNKTNQTPPPCGEDEASNQPAGAGDKPTAPPAPTSTETKPADAQPADAKPADAKPTDAKPSDTQPADAKPVDVTPPVKIDPTKPEPFDKVRDQVVQKLRERKGEAKVDEVIRWIAAELNAAALPLKVDERNYRIVEQGAVIHDLQAIQEKVQKQFGFLPGFVRLENKWLTFEDVSKLEGVGTAFLGSFDSGQVSQGVDYLFSAKELLTDAPEPGIDRSLQKELAVTYRFQAMLAGLPLRGLQGNAYFCRVIAADPTREPSSLDEVREDVVRDYKRLKAYETLKGQREALVGEAVRDGLEKFAMAHGSKVVKTAPFAKREMRPTFRRNPFTGRAMPSNVPGLPTLPDEVGQSEAFIDKAFELAEQANAAGGPSAAPAEKATSLIAVDEGLKVFVAKVTSYAPLTEQEYGTKMNDLLSIIQYQDGQEFMENPLSLENLYRHLGYKPTEPEGTSDKKDKENAAPAEGG